MENYEVKSAMSYEVKSAMSFKIYCINANSIGRNPKRQKVLFHIKKKNPDFIIVCDTRICKSIENTVREEWRRGGNVFLARATSL